MNWPSFVLGLLTFPVLISGLLLARLLLELFLVRMRRHNELALAEDPVGQQLAPRAPF